MKEFIDEVNRHETPLNMHGPARKGFDKFTGWATWVDDGLDKIQTNKTIFCNK